MTRKDHTPHKKHRSPYVVIYRSKTLNKKDRNGYQRKNLLEEWRQSEDG